MANEKKDLGGVGLQIEPPSRPSSPYPGVFAAQQVLNVSNLPKPLTLEEKKYLLSVERGDLANVRRILQRAIRKHHMDINCVDSLGRGALTIAIDAENLEMVELLIIMSVETRDALLQAINAEFVEAVELLLEHEELIHQEGEPYSWQKVESNTSMFTSDMTPLILAAHRNNYEILKILLDRGATIPAPHDTRCGCDDCLRQSSEDSLRHSLSRVNEYRALASPSLIALSSNDPLLTAFQLSWELRNLAFSEQESKTEYLDLRRQCQKFAVDLLDQSRSSQELAIILNYDPNSPPYVDGEHMKLARLELAINYKQKKFVAHPNIQQLLAALWYEGVPGFRRKSAIQKLFIIIKVALLFPIYCLVYMIAPNCSMSRYMKKPFMKFLIHASSYLFFLLILILVSQRAEVQAILLFGTDSMKRSMEEQLRRQRGNAPTPLELLVVLFVIGYIWEETQEIFREGIRNYLRNMWNFIDFSRNTLYCMVALLRMIAYIQQASEIKKDPSTAYIAREHWHDFDPQLIAEGLFAGANIFSALKLVHLFSINPHLGPLQISLGRMVIDIVKFFFIYSLVLFAFACGLNQLLWYFADLEKQKCYHLPNGAADWEAEGDACMKWRRFGNLFESSQSLFWASFGMVGLENFELEGIKSYTRFWGLLIFGSYCVINVIVLLNLLIAMMSNSYAMIDEHSDTEWKFARTKLWMSFFEDGATLPPPFNIMPSVKWITRCFKRRKPKELKRGSTIRRREDRENRYTNVMRSLVWRYVSSMHRRYEESAVTEDDINEVKADISSMRYEMLAIFEKNGMDISSAEKKERSHLAKRMKVWERRLMKDFQVAPITGDEEREEVQQPLDKGIARFRRVAQQVVSQTNSYKWTEAVRGVVDTQIGRCHNRESFKNQQNLKKAMHEAKRLVQKSPSICSRPESPVEFYDPTRETLLALLKNISEEAGSVSVASVSPFATLKAPTVSRHPSPVASLSRQLAEMLSHQKPDTSDRSASTCLSSTRRGMCSIREIDQSKQCKSLADTKSKSVEELNKTGLPSMIDIPVISITKTDSQRLQKNKSLSKESVNTEKSNVDQIPQKAAVDVLHVSKRKNPPQVPIQAANDIALPRPVVLKMDLNQGLISPPPSTNNKSIANRPHTTDVINQRRPSTQDEPIMVIRTNSPTTSQRASTPDSLNNNNLVLDGRTHSRKPSLVGNANSSVVDETKATKVKPNSLQTPASSPGSLSPANSPRHSLKSYGERVVNPNRASPTPLRPIKHVEEVTTIRRQPRAGWL